MKRTLAHVQSAFDPGAHDWGACIGTAMREVFSLMVASEITSASEDTERNIPEHTAMVGLAGVICGVLSIRCSSDAAALIASKMLGMPLEEATGQSRDALGEVCNMVAGAFKNQIKELERDCMLSVPTVITGSDYHLQSLAQGEFIRRDFAFDGNLITVVLQTSQKAGIRVN